MVKALDLSSNGRMSAWVRTPLLTGGVNALSLIENNPSPSPQQSRIKKVENLSQCKVRGYKVIMEETNDRTRRFERLS